ncbi:O-antigen ligase family protein [uncultured Vibrio sp.]|uniref:O-antigen ligase family protein n=1 Tax=uncultured Vibrio sp. TaxID=114054 RepID=UPI0025E14662|nr:O-antigen ligase family protein [uncultured Vibrio sp.]
MKLEKFTLYSLLLLLIWVPIPLGSNRPWAWSIAEIWIALQTLLLLIVYRESFPWNRLSPFKWLLIPLGVFQVWVFIQSISLPNEIVGLLSPKAVELYNLVEAPYYFISLDHRMTWGSLFRGIALWLFVFNAILLLNTPKRLKITVLALVVSGTIQALYAALMVLLNFTESPVFGYPEKGIATGSFVYKNHLANYLMLSLCMGLGLIVTQLHISESGSWYVRIRRVLEGLLSLKMFVRLALVIMVIALVMTRSRMGNTAFFTATTIGGVLALFFYKNKPRALTALVISVIAIDTFAVGALFGLDKVKQRLVETSLQQESRDQVVIWSLDIIKDYPLTGTGMASFYTVFPGYTKSDVGFYDHAHNDYIQFFVEAGIPATLMLGAMVLYSLWLCLETIRVRNSRTMKGLALGSLMAIIGMLIHISVDFNLQPMANTLAFIFILFISHASATMRIKK